MSGYKEAKAIEDWEDMMAKRRGKGLSGLFGRLMRRKSFLYDISFNAER